MCVIDLFFFPPSSSSAGLCVPATCSCFTDCPPAVGTAAQMARRSTGGWTPLLIKCCCASAEGNLLEAASQRACSLTELPLNSEKCLPLFKQGLRHRARLLCLFLFFFPPSLPERRNPLQVGPQVTFRILQTAPRRRPVYYDAKVPRRGAIPAPPAARTADFAQLQRQQMHFNGSKHQWRE